MLHIRIAESYYFLKSRTPLRLRYVIFLYYLSRVSVLLMNMNIQTRDRRDSDCRLARMTLHIILELILCSMGGENCRILCPWQANIDRFWNARVIAISKSFRAHKWRLLWNNDSIVRLVRLANGFFDYLKSWTWTSIKSIGAFELNWRSVNIRFRCSSFLLRFTSSIIFLPKRIALQEEAISKSNSR